MSYSDTSQLANLELEGILSILCFSQPKRAQCIGHPIMEELSIFLVSAYLSVYMKFQTFIIENTRIPVFLPVWVDRYPHGTKRV